MHDHPWHYYLAMLLYTKKSAGPWWSEALIVALAGEGHKWLSAPGRSANMQRIFAGLLVVIALWIFWRSR